VSNWVPSTPLEQLEQERSEALADLFEVIEERDQLKREFLEVSERLERALDLSETIGKLAARVLEQCAGVARGEVVSRALVEKALAEVTSQPWGGTLLEGWRQVEAWQRATVLLREALGQ